MSDIRFKCPQCQNPLAIDDAGAGLQVNCPHCERPIMIPAPTPGRETSALVIAGIILAVVMIAATGVFFLKHQRQSPATTHRAAASKEKAVAVQTAQPAAAGNPHQNQPQPAEHREPIPGNLTAWLAFEFKGGQTMKWQAEPAPFLLPALPEISETLSVSISMFDRQRNTRVSGQVYRTATVDAVTESDRLANALKTTALPTFNSAVKFLDQYQSNAGSAATLMFEFPGGVLYQWQLLPATPQSAGAVAEYIQTRDRADQALVSGWFFGKTAAEAGTAGRKLIAVLKAASLSDPDAVIRVLDKYGPDPKLAAKLTFEFDRGVKFMWQLTPATPQSAGAVAEYIQTRDSAEQTLVSGWFFGKTAAEAGTAGRKLIAVLKAASLPDPDAVIRVLDKYGPDPKLAAKLTFEFDRGVKSMWQLTPATPQSAGAVAEYIQTRDSAEQTLVSGWFFGKTAAEAEAVGRKFIKALNAAPLPDSAAVIKFLDDYNSGQSKAASHVVR